jgi:subtilisin
LRGMMDFFLAVTQIIRARNILPVFAVGNEGPGTSRSPGNYVEALSVGANDNAGRVADFSSSQRFTRAQDPRVPDIVAPGVDVVSAKPGGGFQSMSGSSMATPHVAGLAALLFEAKPSASVVEVENAIFSSSSLGSISPARGNRGIPDAVRAFTALTGTVLGGATKGTAVAVAKKGGAGKKVAKKAGKKKTAVKKSRKK